MKRLWDHWPEAFAAARGDRNVLLLLDFDGTLAPIAPSPDRAGVPEPVRAALRRLSAHPRAWLAVLSGRALRDVRRRVGISSAFYGGNHGLEIRGPGVSFRHPAARRARPALRALAREARRTLAALPGALVEDKGLGVALHGRRVPVPCRGKFLRAVERLRRGEAGRRLAWLRGREVWEALPRVGWDKGRAAMFLSERLGRPYPVAVGDDRTDEDLFAALGARGLTVRVGNGGISRARFHVRGPGEVGRLLRRLEEAL